MAWCLMLNNAQFVLAFDQKNDMRNWTPLIGSLLAFGLAQLLVKMIETVFCGEQRIIKRF